MNSRITDPETLPSIESFDPPKPGESLTIQFSKQNYSPLKLKALNILSKTFGERIEVRFYGHYGQTFDASILKYLPDVKWLSIDCLDKISNEDYIYSLKNIKKLSFGVYDFKRANFLQGLTLENLTELSLGNTKSTQFDLTALTRAEKLVSLNISKHTKNIEKLGTLQNLQALTLWHISKHQSLEFISHITDLQSLSIMLGGRPSIAEIEHPKLQNLTLVRIRGLNDLSYLKNFPNLRYLQIEDQLQIKSLDLNTPYLETLKVLNCKNMSIIENTENLTCLNHVRIYRTQVDLETLSERNWPESVKILALYSGKLKRDKLIRQKLNRKGYKEFG